MCKEIIAMLIQAFPTLQSYDSHKYKITNHLICFILLVRGRSSRERPLIYFLDVL